MINTDKTITVPKDKVYELVGRATLFFAKTYPRNDEALWWKMPEALETVIEGAYRQGVADERAGLVPKPPVSA